MSEILIGITCNELALDPSAFRAGIGAEEQAWQMIAQDYLNAVWNAGAVPILIPIDDDEERTLGMLRRVDGLLVSGGNDVSPDLYGARIKKCGTLDPARDRMEQRLILAALEENKPILGICRGIQILNAVLGGTLHQDLPTEGFELHSIFTNIRNVPTHTVEVKEGSLLSGIIGAGTQKVNSFHHQGVHEVAPGLRVAAVSDDGVVEAVEMPERDFVLAVQWHPEMMFDSEKQQAIFQAFVKACR